jgi:hypothetical protein
VLVKFEKLNPNISSPVSIPVYGEMVTARWGYEALAVEQFVNNRYERMFYAYDKKMSEARFRKDYWNSRIKMGIENLKGDLTKGIRGEDFNDDLQLVSNEFKKESKALPMIRFEYPDSLVPEKVTVPVLNAALDYIESLRRYYVAKYNEANNLKDEYITRLEAKDKEAFIKLRNDYFNKSLEEMVTFKEEPQKIIDFDNEIVQKMDPIYMDPEHKCIKAHFYAPFKMFCGFYIETYLINTIVIWIMTSLLYLALYFRILKRIINFAGDLFRKKVRLAD